MAETENKPQKGRPQDKADEEVLVRILGRDIRGSRSVMVGLTRLKGVGWSIANATCIKLKVPKEKKISELSKDEIKKIEDFLKNADVHEFMKNRRHDPETGETSHLTSNDLDMKKDFDIRRMKKIKSYRGTRHASNLPVRGQRTRSHFRKKGQAVRVRKK